MNVVDQIATPRSTRSFELPKLRERRLGAIAAAVALATVVVTSTIIAIDSASAPTQFVSGSWISYPGWVSGPLRFLGGSRLTGGTYSELTYAMCLAYLALLACSRWISLRTTVIALAFTHLIYLLAPPMSLTDIWNYINYSHLGVIHGLSPYTHLPTAAPTDPSFQWATWPKYPTPYGPLFTALTYAIAPLGVAGGLWTLKAFFVAAAGGVLYLVYHCARRLRLDPVPALLLVGLSPVWLVWTVGGFHNDVLMLLFGVAGIALWLDGRDLPAAFMIVLGSAVKMPVVLLLPFLFLRARDRVRFAVGAVAGVLTVAVVSLLAFGSLSPLTAFNRQNGFESSRSIIGQVFRLFSMPERTPDARTPAALLFVLAVLVLIVLVWRYGVSPLVAAGWATIALLLELLWEFPWYVAWLLPLAALAMNRRLKAVSLILSVLMLLIYVAPTLALSS
jgi:hypothetical protein